MVGVRITRYNARRRIARAQHDPIPTPRRSCRSYLASTWVVDNARGVIVFFVVAIFQHPEELTCISPGIIPVAWRFLVPQ